MIYPEIPKTRFRSTYIAGGIFSFLFGAILIALYFPKACDKMFGILPWDWNVIGLNNDFLIQIQDYICILFPFIAMVIIGASFLIGRARSSTFAKLSMLVCMVGVIIKYAPFGLSADITQYIELGLGGVALVLLVLAIIKVCSANEKEKPYHANSFHLFAATFLTLLVLLDGSYKLLHLDTEFGFAANFEHYVFPFFLGLFCVIAGIWLLILMERPEIEFGAGHISKKKFEKLAQMKNEEIAQAPTMQAPTQNETEEVAEEVNDKKKQKEELKKQKEAEKLLRQQEKQQAKLNKKAKIQEEQPAQPQPEIAQPQVQETAQQPEPTQPQENLKTPKKVVPEQTAPQATPTPQPQQAPQPQAQPAKPNLPPLQVGPDGIEYRIITQKLPNGKIVQLRIDKNGKPLPPLPKK